MNPVSLTDLLNLHAYFSAKREPTALDKNRLVRLDEWIGNIVDGTTQFSLERDKPTGNNPEGTQQ